MKILVTGSSGFVAYHLIPRLASNGHSIVGIDKRKGNFDFGKQFRFVHGNILEDRVLKAAMADCDSIIHLAAEHQDFGVPERLFYEVNVEGTNKLLHHADHNHIQRFIFYSSVAVYGDTAQPTHEGLPTNPGSAYGKSKLMVEQAIQDWYSRDKRRQALILRPTVVFGPQNYANMYKLISTIAMRRYITVGHGRNIKSLAYVENLADATLFLMNTMNPGVQIYNYVDSPQLESRAIASTIAEALNVRVSRLKVPVALAMSLAYPFDLFAAATNINLPITSKRIKKFATPTHHLGDKLRNLGLVPQFTTEDGIRKMVSWYLSTRQSYVKTAHQGLRPLQTHAEE